MYFVALGERSLFFPSEHLIATDRGPRTRVLGCLNTDLAAQLVSQLADVHSGSTTECALGLLHQVTGEEPLLITSQGSPLLQPDVEPAVEPQWGQLCMISLLFFTSIVSMGEQTLRGVMMNL